MKRLFSYDITRVTALFMIVMIHVSAYIVIFFPDVNGKEWLVGNIFNGVGRAGVPLFIMLTGALLLNENKRIDARQFYKKSLMNMLFLAIGWLLFYGLFYAFILPALKGDSVSISNLWEFIIYFRGSEYPHLWYMYMVLGLYLMIPMLRLFVKKENKRYIEGIIAISLIAQFLRRSLGLFPSGIIADIATIIDKLCLEPATGYIGYLLLGWYLDNFDLKESFKKLLYVLGAIAFVGSTVAIYFIIDRIPAARDYLYDQKSLPPVVYASALFVLFRSVFRDKVSKKGFVATLSRYSFGIYIIHVLFLEILVQIILPYEKFTLNSPLIYILLVLGLVMGLSYLTVLASEHMGKAKKIFYVK